VDKNKDLPRCDKCECCIFRKSKKYEGYTYYCTITGRDVGQSHFGQNSPRTCPRRMKTNQKENNMQKRLKEIKPGEEKATKTEDITDLIKRWAEERNLDKADPKAQMVKLMEELGELANGINKGRKEQIIDSIGDTYVVLTILSMQLGLDIKDCIKAAYEEIKDRKGKMVNGTFVKEEDL
jgi:hypothetical protein